MPLNAYRVEGELVELLVRINGLLRVAALAPLYSIIQTEMGVLRFDAQTGETCIFVHDTRLPETWEWRRIREPEPVVPPASGEE